jgi:hypothetical protein
MFWMIATLSLIGCIVLGYAYQIGWAKGFESAEKIWKASAEEQVALYRNAMAEMTSKIKK